MKILRIKTYSDRHRTGSIVVSKKEIQELKSLSYPKLYVNFLDKVNPLIQEFAKVIDDTNLIHAAIILELGGGNKAKFPNEDFGPYSETKDGKTYHCFFYDDLDSAEEFGYSDIAGVLWCDDTGNNWYTKKGMLFKKFEKVDDPKAFLKSYFAPEDWDYYKQDQFAEKICREIDKL